MAEKKFEDLSATEQEQLIHTWEGERAQAIAKGDDAQVIHLSRAIRDAKARAKMEPKPLSVLEQAAADTALNEQYEQLTPDEKAEVRQAAPETFQRILVARARAGARKLYGGDFGGY